MSARQSTCPVWDWTPSRRPKSEFRIGAMASLRALELHEGLAAYTNGAMRESVRHIVGVQLRNLATVGGSLYSRFGFSDVLSAVMAMDCSVELYKGGPSCLCGSTPSALMTGTSLCG